MILLAGLHLDGVLKPPSGAKWPHDPWYAMEEIQLRLTLPNGLEVSTGWPVRSLQKRPKRWLGEMRVLETHGVFLLWRWELILVSLQPLQWIEARMFVFDGQIWYMYTCFLHVFLNFLLNSLCTFWFLCLLTDCIDLVSTARCFFSLVFCHDFFGH